MGNRVLRGPRGVKRQEPAVRSVRGTGKTVRAPFLRALWVEIERYDWPHEQMVCFRLYPTMRPESFCARVRALPCAA